MNDALRPASADWTGFYLVCLIWWAALLVLALYVAQQKGRSTGEAALISILFGPLGVIIVALLPTLEIRQGSTAPGSSTAAGGARKKRRNATPDEWKDMIDWSGVATEEDEKRAKKAAYRKYLSVFGPTMTDVAVSENGRINFTCECGHRMQATPDKVGTAIACVGCGLHLLVPPPPAP